jgi:RNA recognition motif-containing protein
VCDQAAIPIERLAAFCSILEREKMETKIYVGNLSYDTTEDKLKEMFSQAGTVASVALIKDRDTGQSKGFAFVEMSNQAEAEKAIQMYNGKTLGSRELKVNLARPREERGPGGYGRSGPGGNRRGPGGGQRRY